MFLLELHVHVYMNTFVFTARASIRAGCLKSEGWHSRLMKQSMEHMVGLIFVLM